MSTGTFWSNNNLEQKIIEVLADVAYYNPDHHFGRPFLTAYQLAILFKERFRTVFESFGHPIGGKGSGVSYSFTKYLANQLSRKIQSGEITSIEGSFISNRRLRDIEFSDEEESITSSSTDTRYDLSLFRIRSELCE